jgi:hypothetical protein
MHAPIVKAPFLNLGRILLHDYTTNIHVDVMNWPFFLKRLLVVADTCVAK